MKSVRSIKILDIPLFDGKIEDFFHLFVHEIKTQYKSCRQVSFCDAHVLVSAKTDAALKELLAKECFLNMPDGMPGVFMGRLKGSKRIERCYGPDVFEYLIRNTSKMDNVKHYFTGGREGVADDLKEVCRQKFENENIVGTHCPPFRELSEKEIKQVADDINNKNADVVWVGISSPKQDFYAKRLRKYLKVHFIFTIGAAFDFYTGNVSQAPKIIQRIGFEWFYRIFADPKRLLKRYVRVIPMFLYYALLDFMLINRKPI